MARLGRRFSSGSLMVVGAAATCVTLGSAAAVPAPAAAPEPANYFDVKVESEGSFVADYGDDRHSSDSRGFGTDGKTTISWHWEAQAAARPQPNKGLDLISGRSLRFRSVMSETSNGVEYDHLGGPSGGELREFPWCQPPTYANTRRTADQQDDSVPSGEDLSRGEWVTGPLLELFNKGGLRIRGMADATTPDECVGHTDMHGLSFSYLLKGDAKLPPKAFDPTTDDRLDEEFRDAVNEPLEHDGIAPAYHTAVGSSSMTLTVRRVSRNTWQRLRDKYADSGEYGLQNCAPDSADPNC